MQYEITFRHSRPTEGKLRETECIIYNDKGQALARGVAVCSPHDNFNKSTGRKTALNDALYRNLANPNFSRKARATIWAGYLNKWGYNGCSSFGRGGF